MTTQDQRYYLSYETRRGKLEREYTVKLSREINKAINQQLPIMLESGGNSIQGVDMRGVTQTLIDLYTETFVSFASWTYRHLRRKTKDVARDIANTFSQRASDWVTQNGSSKIQGINNTIIEQTNSIISNALAQSLTLKETTELLNREINAYSLNRAKVIARTETTAAAGISSLQAAGIINTETGGIVRKKWITAIDGRERATHRQVMFDTAQGIKLEDDFNVGTDVMHSCGRGSEAKENVNCRCAIGYVILRDD